MKTKIQGKYKLQNEKWNWFGSAFLLFSFFMSFWLFVIFYNEYVLLSWWGKEENGDPFKMCVHVL